jgi:hypothetical protein
LPSGIDADSSVSSVQTDFADVALPTFAHTGICQR